MTLVTSMGDFLLQNIFQGFHKLNTFDLFHFSLKVIHRSLDYYGRCNPKRRGAAATSSFPSEVTGQVETNKKTWSSTHRQRLHWQSDKTMQILSDIWGSGHVFSSWLFKMSSRYEAIQDVQMPLARFLEERAKLQTFQRITFQRRWADCSHRRSATRRSDNGLI